MQPLDPRLAAVAEELERTGWAAELADAQWRLVWMSSELQTILGEDDPEQLGIGLHAAVARLSPALRNAVDHRSGVAWFRLNLPRMASDTPGGLPAILEQLPEDFVDEIGPLEPEVVDGPWTGENTFNQRGLPPAQTRYMVCPLADPQGRRFGFMLIFGGGIPASLLSLVARGSRSMFSRMARLLEPGRHETAVLFADIQGSSQLARRLATGRFFELIRAFATAADASVIRHGGIVGRHAGDGLSAFFLAEQIGGRAAACAAALRAGMDAVRWRPDGEDLPDGLEVPINVAVHWGGALYLGQLVTGGRLEVTALGDEVNEAARMQQSARDGTLLASKALVERLDPGDAEELGLRPRDVVYRTVAELPGAGEKAVRDAGSIPVVDLTTPV